jgi:hypothetical protein
MASELRNNKSLTLTTLKGREIFSRQRPQRFSGLVWVATRAKPTVSVTPNRLRYCVHFIVY